MSHQNHRIPPSATRGLGPHRAAGNLHHATADIPDGTYVTELRTTFVVPSVPEDTSDHDVFLYLWPGTAAGGVGSILQPVLAFHAGYPKWYLHTYAIYDGKDQHGHDIPHAQGTDYDVNVGDTVTGVVRLEEITDDGYTYRVLFTDGDGKEYPSETACEQTWPQPATYICQYIEPWGNPTTDQYPAEEYLKMYDIELTTDKGRAKSITWTPGGPKVRIVDGDVWLPYRT
ncbi:hypothetical protein ACFQ6N_17520 [Kitasatospora sp. NPDC056446]|uniref:hypothetical protein n=1 Tax=Kitasatospora sp. NPDC056446 TaxID=3345819 RepID=UPI0036B52FB5